MSTGKDECPQVTASQQDTVSSPTQRATSPPSAQLNSFNARWGQQKASRPWNNTKTAVRTYTSTPTLGKRSTEQYRRGPISTDDIRTSKYEYRSWPVNWDRAAALPRPSCNTAQRMEPSLPGEDWYESGRLSFAVVVEDGSAALWLKHQRTGVEECYSSSTEGYSGDEAEIYE